MTNCMVNTAPLIDIWGYRFRGWGWKKLSIWDKLDEDDETSDALIREFSPQNEKE